MSDQNHNSRFSIGARVRPLVGRLRRLARDIGLRAWQNPWLSGGLVVVVVGMAVALSISMAWQFAPLLPEVTVEAALEQLDVGNYELARTMAEELRLRTDLPPEESGTPSYILGMLMASQIEREWRRRQTMGLRILAIGYLEESRVRGYPSGRAAEADLLLGKLYFDTEQFPRSMPPLTEALAGLPEQASPINRLLADACLRSADPDWQNAQRHLSALLKDTELATEPRAQAELDLARAYFELGELTRCEAVLSKMNKNTEVYSEAAMLRGRVFMGEADAILLEDLFDTTVPDAARDKYVQAAVIFDELLEGVVGTRSNDLIRQARYLRAICRMKQGLNAEAETELANIRRGNFSMPEGLASALAIAELQQSQGRDQDAAAMFRSVISQAVAMSPYENQWMSLTQFLERLEGAYRKFLDAKQFDHALVIAKGMAPLVLSKQTVELSAIAERGWAQQLELEVADAALADRPQIMSRAQTAWMRAGRLYEQLARLRYSERLFPQDVWNSAECYFNGHEYQRTTKLLMLYLENEARSNHPRYSRDEWIVLLDWLTAL